MAKPVTDEDLKLAILNHLEAVRGYEMFEKMEDDCRQVILFP